MPGSIRVSVLESVDLPAEATGGNCVSIKVTVGKREFQTKPSKVVGDKTAAWNSDFAFPVLNLRDNLIVVLLNSKGNAVARTDIETPSIVEKGFWDELFPLKGGGRIHLKLSFVLTEEEWKRIQAIRAAAMKRKENGVLKKNASIRVLRAAAENGESALASGTGIPQSIPENLQSRGANDYKENEVPVPSVPQVSETSDALLKIEHIPEASGELLVASTSSTFEPASKEEVSTQDSKNVSGHDLPHHGHKDLPRHRCEETGRALPCEKLNQSKEPILSEELSSPPYQIFSTFEEARDEAVMQANTTVLNQDLQHAEGFQREGHADSEYVETDDAIDKPRMIGTRHMKVEEEDMAAKLQESLIVPVTSSCQTLVATQGTQKIDASGSPLHLANESITSKMTSSGHLSVFQTSRILDSIDPASELHTGGTCRAPLSESITALVNDRTANFDSLKHSNEEDMTPSSLFSSSGPLQYSTAGSVSPILPNVAGDETPHQPISPKRSQTDPTLQKHESAINAEPPPPVSLVYDPAISEKNDALETHSDHAVGSGSMQASEEACLTRPLSSAENTQIFVQGIYPVQCNKEDTPGIVLPTDTSIGSLSGSSTGVLHENFSPQTVSGQSFSTEDGIAKPVSSSVVNLPDNSGDVPKPWPSAVSSVADTVTTVSAASFSPPAVQALKENSTQSSVKAKIKAFESNLSQDSDHHGSSPLKSQDHKIQAERAVQRLRAEAAAAQAAEARRRAEEEEARLKSISEEEAKRPTLQQRLEGSRFRHASKLKGKFLQKNEEQTRREMEEEIKEFNVTEEDLRTQKTSRIKENMIQGTEDKVLDVRDREKKHALVERADLVFSPLIHETKSAKPDGNRQMADAIALKRRLEEQGKNPLKPSEEGPGRKPHIWETTRLGELQSDKKRQDGTLKPELCAEKKSVGEQSRIGASAKASGAGKQFEGKQHLEVQKARMCVAESSQISADEKKSEDISTSKQTKEFASTMESNRAFQFAEYVESSGADSAKDKEKQRQGSEHDIAFDQRVQPMISRTSFIEDIPCEGGSITSEEEELEDLLKSSNAFGGFIKQALAAAAVLAAGALFMWVRGERMNRRRANTTQPKERHYFQQKGEESTRVLPQQSEEPDFGIPKPNSKVVEIEEVTRLDYLHHDIFLENTRCSYKDDLGDQLHMQTKEGSSKDRSSMATFPNSLTMTIDFHSNLKTHSMTWQEVEQVVRPEMVLSIYKGGLLEGGDMQISCFTHPKMCQLASPIYEQIYGDKPHDQKVPMYFAMQLYAHLILGYKVDFRSMPKEIHISDHDDGIHCQIARDVKNEHEHVSIPNIVINAPHDIVEEKAQFLIKEKKHLESIVQRERQHLRNKVQVFCVISERTRRDIDMAKGELNGLINAQRDLENSLKNVELQLCHAYLENLEMLEAQRSRFIAQVGDVMQQIRATTTWVLELQSHIRDHREQALQTLMFVREIEMRCRLVHQELDMLLGGMQGHSHEFLYSRFLLMPYFRGNIKSNNLESITYVDLHKPSCSVCLSSLQQDGFYGLQCGHLHHFSCLLVHIIGQNKCANCREEVSFGTYLTLGIEDFIPNGQILDEVGLHLECTPKKYL